MSLSAPPFRVIAITIILAVLPFSGCELINPPEVSEEFDCASQAANVVLSDNPDLAVDYTINCDLSIETSLTIEAGTVIEMGSGASIQIGENATLNINGTAESPVVIRGSQSASDFWDGIRINSKLDGNRIHHAHISDGASGWNFTAPAMIWMGGSGSIAITNSVLSNTEIGVYINSGATLDQLSGDTLTACNRSPIDMCVHHLGALTNTNVFSSNQVERIEVYACERINEDQTWEFAALPILVEQQVTVEENVTLTIREGVTLLMDDYFKVKGTLKVEGTENNPVEFNGHVQDSPGYWSVLSFDTFSDGSTLDHAIISGGGAYEASIGYRGNVNILRGSVTITNSTISNGSNCGINVRTAEGSLTASDNTFFNLEGDDICLN